MKKKINLDKTIKISERDFVELGAKICARMMTEYMAAEDGDISISLMLPLVCSHFTSDLALEMFHKDLEDENDKKEESEE